MDAKFGIVVFPGSNCDHDSYYAVHNILGYDAEFIWHKETSFDKFDVIILPGGFSYGDYLRPGAIARFSPVMNKVIDFAENGGHVLGICNGFQVLMEAGLLPGVLVRNKSLNFISKPVYLKIENNNTNFTNKAEKQVVKFPVAHGDGNYFANPDTIKELEDQNRIVFRYSSKEGEVNDDNNPNGSAANIAGIINKRGNVMGLMPHPERASDPDLGMTDGQFIFKSLSSSLFN